MSLLTYGSPIVASSGTKAASAARVFQVPQASPVKAIAEVWSDHGPAGYTSCGAALEPPIRARTNPRSPRLTMSWA